VLSCNSFKMLKNDITNKVNKPIIKMVKSKKFDC
jgi:hypothetical protein